MSANTTDQASSAPSRPDDFLRSNSASGISVKRWMPRRGRAAEAGTAGGGGALLTDHHVDLLGQLAQQLLQHVAAQELPDRRARRGPHQHAARAQLLGR